MSNEAALNQLVVDGVLPDRVMAGWCLAHGESFPTPRGNELVVLKITFIVDLALRSIHSFMD